MAFKPLHGRIITENCDVNGDFLITGDVLVDGTLRMAPTIVYQEADAQGFDKVVWNYTQYFDSGEDFFTEGWITGDDYVKVGETDYNGWYQDNVNWPHDYGYILGREQLPANEGGLYGSGEVHQLIYSGDDWNQVNNTDGWSAEFTFYIPVYPNEDIYDYHKVSSWMDSPVSAAQGGYWYIDFDDGIKKGRIFIDPWSTIFVPSEHDKKVRELQLGIDGNAHAITPPKYYFTYTLYPRTMRITVKGDEIWITTNVGVKGATSSNSFASAFVPSGNVTAGFLSSSSSFSPTTYTFNIPGQSPTSYTPNATSSGYPAPGTSTGLPNGSVFGPNGAIGFYSSPKGEVPPTQRTPIDPWNEQHTFHVEDVGLAASLGTKSISFNHSVLGERVAGRGASASVIMVDSFKVDRQGYPVDNGPYSGDFISYTSAVQPTFPVASFDKTAYGCVIPSNGETYITPQYYSGDWFDYGSPLQITGESQSVDLSGIAVASDLTDKLRFKIQQTAVPPSGEPPRVDFIAVMATQVTGEFAASPSFGPAAGNNWITLSWQNAPGSFADAQDVWVGGTQISAPNIEHVDAETKRIKMPAKSAGTYPIKVIGSTYWSIKPYTYVETYDLETDVGVGTVPTGELEIVFGNTRSPFRVLSHPPSHAVNLALMGTTPMSIGTHMSLVNLSDKEPANLTGYGVLDNHLYNGISGDFEFSDAVDTADVLISNRAAMWRNLGAPTPLYYKYLVGRDRFYLHVPEATGVEDLETIRAALTIYEDGGSPASFQWDIAISDTDYYGETLPLGLYSVVLFTSNISINTMWVSFRGADRLTDYESVGTRRETINPVPLFDTGASRMEFSVAASPSGSYDISVEV